MDTCDGIPSVSEEPLRAFLNTGFQHPAWDVVMASLSSWAVWWPFAVVGALGLLLAGGAKGRLTLVAALLAIGVSDGLVCRTLKELVQRPRPHEMQEGVRVVDLKKATPRILAVAKPVNVRISVAPGRIRGGRSFPSSHAANCFALAMVLALSYRRGWVALPVALAVAVSRIYTGSHWPSDVLAGSMIGILCGWGAVWVSGALALRWFPGLFDRPKSA